MDKQISQLSQFTIAVPGIAGEVESLDENFKLCPPSVHLPEYQSDEEKEFLGVSSSCCY